ncbi:MAG: DUF3592 domain-containing protein [Candidatus Hodarchaeota archaeon]
MKLWQFKLAFVIGGLISGFVGLILFYAFIKCLRLGLGSKNWPKVEGEIVSSSIVEDDEGFKPEISFTFNVYGVDYTGSAYNPNELVARSIVGKISAEKKIAEYPVGKTVEIYYNPDDPRKAVLEPGISKDTFFFLLGAGLFFLGCLVFTPIGLFFNEPMP